MNESSLSNSPERDEALRGVHVMLRYALAEGLELDDKARSAISTVEQSEPSSVAFDILMTAHAALSKVVAPATPCSLEATEPVAGFLGFLRRPPLIKWLIICAVAAAIGFVYTSISIVQQSEGTKKEKAQASPAGFVTALMTEDEKPLLLVPVRDASAEAAGQPSAAPPWEQQLNWLFAAALGASFYGLFTAHEYVKNRTFDPRYNSVYLIRFILGIVAGLILATLAPVFKDNTTLSRLGPAVIALLGGFSAEAVNQVLQRLVDIVLAVIRGDNSGAVKAKVSQTAQQELLSLAGDPNVTPAMRDRIHDAIRKVGQ